MADWTAPFKLPTFSNDEFEKQKAAYTEKHGYTISLPAWDDIIHLKQFKPLTEQETKLWTGDIKAAEIPDVEMSISEIQTWIKTKEGPPPTTRRPNEAEQKAYKANLKNLIPQERREEIRVEKEKRKTRIVNMLASPAPKILRSIGSWAVAVDNAQDCLATLACIGMVTAAVVGGTTAALLSGPIGWLAGGAALLNLINPMKYLKWPKGGNKTGRAAKKDLEKFSDKNPLSKKSRAKTVAKIRAFKPSTANAIEALQVTDNIFGVGICLGPIVGLAQDILSGAARTIMGEKVRINKTPPKLPAHAELALKTLKSQAVLHGIPWKSDSSIEIQSLIASNLALQVAAPYLEAWNPFDEVEDLSNCMIEAPRPTDPLTIEIINELGYNLDDVCNWPQNGERFISLGELAEITAPIAKTNLNTFAEENKNSVDAFIAGQNANDFGLGIIEAIEGPGSISIEYSHIERIIIIILDNGWVYPAEITAEQIEKFEDWCYVHEYMNTQPTAKDIWRYAETFCGFNWVKSPEEAR
ncbi:MAG: hypothetical protein PHV93_05170 [Candidatus Pacebacteria bacterium]|nr:hypothetical protein [Candidatus Paceibacterota bacterium]